MEAWLQQWLSLLLRWSHFIVGIAWIGASFYFNWLENHLQGRHLQRRNDSGRDDPLAAGDAGDPIAGDPIAGDPISGELWAVHGGGFYYLQKFRVAPRRLPETLHWFKYEAYFTWITGLALLAVVYYWNAAAYLLDPAISTISPPQAIGLGVASLAASWLVYDGLCRALKGRHPAMLSVLIVGWFAALAFLLGQFFSGRAMYIHVGAAIGTVMAANVFFVIIPAQKELVAALAEGRDPDASKGRNALQRSRHNNYFTLPVLFSMVANHYPATYGSPHHWLILLVFSLAAVGIRHWFNLRHLERNTAWILWLSLLVLAALVLATVPRQAGVPAGPVARAPSTAEIMPVIVLRCAGCHALHPSFAGLNAPPLGVTLDSEQQADRQAERIYQVTVATRTMPLGNITAMTEAERELVAQWYAGQLQNTP